MNRFLFCFLFLGFLSAWAESPWQLRLIYSDSGTLELRDAQAFEPTGKPLKSPGAGGALYQVPVRLEWITESGSVLSSSETHLPLGRRVSPAATRDIPGYLPPQSMVVLRVNGPSDGAEPFTLRVTDLRPGNLVIQQYPRLIPNQSLPIPQRTVESNATFRPSPPPTLTDVIQVSETGPDTNRIVMVIFGDGYLEEDINGGIFDMDVDTVLEQLFSYSPWDEILNAANVYSVDVVSNERGADYEDASPGSGGTEVDTYFDSQFYNVPGIERNLGISIPTEEAIMDLADDLIGVGVWDQLMLIVNSDKYGGSGGPISTNSMNLFGPDIAVHEIGHSFANLGDEYDTPGGPYPVDGLTWLGEVNISLDGENPSWSHWIEESTPLPTPDTSQYDGVVGAFEGAYYASTGAFRPVRSCMMRDLGAEFCPVCAEALLKETFSRISLVDTPNSNLVNDTEFLKVKVDALPINGLSYTWYVNGVEAPGIPNFDNFTFNFTGESSATTIVEVDVAYTGSTIRDNPPVQTATFTISDTGMTPLGTPRWWLLENNFSSADGTDEIDHDGDGVPTAAEFTDQTDPNNIADFSPASQTITPDPTNVTATDGSFLDRINISWDDAPGATSYKLYKNTEDNFNTASLFPVEFTDTLVLDSAVESGVTYFYWVVAVGSGGDSDPSASDFGFLAESFIITAASENSSEGTVMGGGTFTSAEEVELEATPDDGFFFVEWQENGRTASINRVFFFTPDKDRTLTAIFDPIPGDSGPVTGVDATDGTLSGRVLVSWDASETADSYRIYRGTTPLFLDASFLFDNDTFTDFQDQLAEDGVVYYYWITEVASGVESAPSVPDSGFIDDDIIIDASSANSNQGAVTGGGTTTPGTGIHLLATPKTGFLFEDWKEGGLTAFPNSAYSFIASGDRTLVATFSVDPEAGPNVTITTGVSPQEGGSVIGGGVFPTGTTLNLIATPSPGYLVESWTVGGITVLVDETYTFAPTEDTSVTVNFVEEDGVIVEDPEDTAPTITRSRLGGALWEGSGATLSISVSGTSPFTFLWEKDGTVITGANSQILEIPVAGVADSGSYKVTVSNSFGSDSATGSLSVRALPEDPSAELFKKTTRIEVIPNQDWRYIDWLGLLLVDDFPWVYNPDYGWLYFQQIDGETDSIFAYHPSLGWLWISERLVIGGESYLYRYTTGSLLWFGGIEEETGTAWYYQYGTGTWIGVPVP